MSEIWAYILTTPGLSLTGPVIAVALGIFAAMQEARRTAEYRGKLHRARVVRRARFVRRMARTQDTPKGFALPTRSHQTVFGQSRKLMTGLKDDLKRELGGLRDRRVNRWRYS